MSLMDRRKLLKTFLIVVSLSTLLPLSTSAAAADPIDDSKPLAAQYPGDRGIADDPAVLFVENFEHGSVQDLTDRWETVRNRDVMSYSDVIPTGSAGSKSLLMSQEATKGTGGDLYRRLEPGQQHVFMRMYVRFAVDCQPLHHFGTCLGGNHPSTAWPMVKAGQPPAGDKSFWVGIEPFGRKWTWDYYTYWQDMRGSPPRGQTWGNSFVHDPDLKVRRGSWTCVEVMVKVNRLGQSDGQMALWIDGRQVSHLGAGFPRGKWVFDKFLPGEEGDGVRWNRTTGQRESFTTAPDGDPFEGFQFRTVEPLDVNFVWLYVYITKGTPGHVNRIWFDDVVVAKKYIGPLHDDNGRAVMQP